MPSEKDKFFDGFVVYCERENALAVEVVLNFEMGSVVNSRLFNQNEFSAYRTFT